MHGLTFHRGTLAALSWLTLSIPLATTSVRAADASDWAHEKHSAARLIGGGLVNGSPQLYRAGIEIKLAPGWKTYWRYPGDSGVPPRFDFSGSRNVKNAEVLWPAPSRFADAGGFSIGYKEAVILPLRITSSDPAQPVSLTLALDYAICEKLCVPAEAKLQLHLDKQSVTHDAALAASERRTPKRAALGEPAALAIQSVRVDRTGAPRVIVTIVAPKGAKADLFAEGPSGNWSLPLPEPVGDHTGATVRQFAFNLDGVPPETSTAAAIITLTAVTDETAIEVAAPLD